MGNGQRLIRGAFILTAAGLLTRMIGFFYRIFLSHVIGAEGMGIYQLIFPLRPDLIPKRRAEKNFS